MKNVLYCVLIGVLISSCHESSSTDLFYTIVSDPKQTCEPSQDKAMCLTNTSKSKKIVVTYLVKETGQNDFTESKTLEPGEIRYVCIPSNASISISGER
jgi:hypothetical protein